MTTSALTAPQDVTERHKVAYHEAGHALAFILTGAKFRYATINALYADGQLADPRYPRRSAWNKIIALQAAGAVAESLIHNDRRDIATAAGDDLKNMRYEARGIRQYALDHPTDPFVAGVPEGATVHDIAAMGWATACDLVLTNYGSVRAVADALVSSRRALTCAQIRHIIETAPPAPLPGIPDDMRTFWPARFNARLKWTPSRSRRQPR